MQKILLLLLFVFTTSTATVYAENGYDLWLRYEKINEKKLSKHYRSLLKQLVFPGHSETFAVAKKEIETALEGMLQLQLPEHDQVNKDGTLLIGTPVTSNIIAGLPFAKDIETLGKEGFLIRSVKVNGRSTIVIAANTDVGVLYGVFKFLNQLQMHKSIKALSIREVPKIQYRMLNHWDNLDGSVERGYAGSSIWDWQLLPGYIDPRYHDYGRANASVGINGTVLNNVNANARSLKREYLIKTAAIADVLRKYGMKVYLTARFSAPMEIGGLDTADPFDPKVQKWWKMKAEEIYALIPDFGGFLVKANSEGQPGPQDYNRTHAEGANMMAQALAPHGGIVMWRAFVYQNNADDRAKQAYAEFKPLDGKFNSNVFLQPKYGPIDFQPREAYHPLFGAMPETPLMMEFQITQEYFGWSTHLVYLAPLFEEYLDMDTYAKGKGSTIAKIVKGELDNHNVSGIAGVSNIGSDVNWTGHPFGQANWYAFGRMAWEPDVSSAEVAEDWLRMTFTNDQSFVAPVKKIMLASRAVAVNYMTPLGLNHIMDFATHYGPGPWYKDPHWDAWDYHHADSIGLGYDRSTTGSNAVSKYYSPLRDSLNNIELVPEELLLWFHHVPWDYKMPSGRTFWSELVHHYYAGVKAVEDMKITWDKMEGKIDDYRFDQVKQLLAEQKREAAWWRDACVLYFQTFSKRPIPDDLERPKETLLHYRRIPFPDR